MSAPRFHVRHTVSRMHHPTAPPTASASQPLLPTKWRWQGLLLCNALALLLLASWLWQPTRGLWDGFDDALFAELNTSLAGGGAWARLWAVMSLRPMDVVGGLAMATLVVRGGFVVSAPKVRSALFTFIALSLMVLVLRTLFDYGFVKPLQIERSSPSLIRAHVIRLSELFPDWTLPIKDASSNSFPGDHAAVALAWALLLSLFARGWRLLAVWALTGILLLPRLVAGAHWGSDDFVGGLFVALLSIGWGCYTPYAARVQLWLERVTAPLRRRLKRLPLLRRLAVLR